MKSRLLFISILYFTTISNSYVVDTWSKIENKTWVSQEPLFGSQFVFLKNKFDEKKAIFQLYGSGCYVIATIIYNVEVNDNIIKITLSDPDLKVSKENQSNGLQYLDDRKEIADIDGKQSYHIMSEEPIIYKLCAKKVDVETLRNDTITMNDFRK